MGGREGGRGYLYQSIATLLGSLNNDEWKYVEVEVESDNDKIDIQWEYNDGKKTVVQVKSSQNNIPKGSMIKWLKDLTEDAPEADQFQLFLIGNVQDTTSKFISKVNRIEGLKTDDDDYDNLKDLIEFLPKIKIVLENFNQASLEANIKWGLSELLSTMGHVVSPTLIGLMADGMLSQFSRFSTNGKKVKREKYIKQFEDWIYFNYPQVKGHGLTKKVLSVEFYLKNQIEFNNTMTAIKGNSLNLISSRKERLMEFIRRINSINLPPYKEKEKEANEETEAITGSSILNMSSLKTLGSLGSPKTQYKSEEISDEGKEKINSKTKELLGVDIEKEFFYVGQLRKSDSILDSQSKAIGNELEKRKGSLIDNFIIELLAYEGIAKYIHYINSFNIVPIVLRNTGFVSDEDIEVNIKFPKDVTVKSELNLKHPNPYIIEEFDENEDLINNLFKHQRSYNIEEFVGVGQDLPFFDPAIMKGFYTPEELDRLPEKRVLHKLGQVFDFKIYEDNEYNVLQFLFKRLNSSKNMAFPSFLLIDASESFTIEYEITSKNLGDKIEGSLYYEIQ
ncbi:hypothetical protein P4689_12135 [Priestia megaterium]|uniref:hypothetical protein n=1 Tax=Priestia megaterium TaxID=1404 RepID=UPI002E1BF51E|nr:hypothetical protein [Priestia megaterium]